MRLAFEWRPASKELVSKDSNAPDVNTAVIRTARDHFWWQIIQSTAESVSVVLWSVGAPAKVREFDSSHAVQNVLRLDVSVYDILLMQVNESLNHLVDVRRSSCLSESFIG